MCVWTLLSRVQLFVTVRGILQARILEWVAIPFSRGSSQPLDRTRISCIVGRRFTGWATREAPSDETPLSSYQNGPHRDTHIAKRRWRAQQQGLPSPAWWKAQRCRSSLVSYKAKHTLTTRVKAKVTQSCPTLCDPRDCVFPGILQARILEWVAVPFPSGSFQTRDQTQVSRNAGGFSAYQLSHQGYTVLTTITVAKSLCGKTVPNYTQSANFPISPLHHNTSVNCLPLAECTSK